MSVAYIETFVILGTEYGIEDFKDGRPSSEHFMMEERRKRKEPRFQCWRGGSGIGSAKTLALARKKIYEYAVAVAEDESAKAFATYQTAQATLKKLGNDPSFLFRFEKPEIV